MASVHILVGSVAGVVMVVKRRPWTGRARSSDLRLSLSHNIQIIMLSLYLYSSREKLNSERDNEFHFYHAKFLMGSYTAEL